ncbi:hypothetical protein, partial [Paenibacillus rhizolycopersici]|uniref:hypothetical protein n=1 Tax=Paenibacillus rhizolycopersici TaxID=2780073 RepID=UPI003D27AB8D
MGKLIDADKLLEWLDEAKECHSDLRYHAFRAVEDAYIAGRFDPDPIPLPTIKPGDKVVIT